jgi:hypothetical protein
MSRGERRKMRERRLSGKWKAGRLLSAFFPSAALLLGRQSELRKLAQGSLPTALQYASLAEIELTVGLTAQARCLLSNGVKLFPNNPTLWNLLLGAAEAECHHPTKATVDFDRAISLGLRYVGIYLKEFEGAYNPHILFQTLKTNHQLLQFNPWNAEGNFQFELVALEKGDFGDCLGHVKNIPESHRNNPRVRAVLCADLAATEQVNRARREAASLLESPNLREYDVSLAARALARHRQVVLCIYLLEGLHHLGLALPRSLEEIGALEESSGRLSQARPNNVDYLMR